MARDEELRLQETESHERSSDQTQRSLRLGWDLINIRENRNQYSNDQMNKNKWSQWFWFVTTKVNSDLICDALASMIFSKMGHGVLLLSSL